MSGCAVHPHATGGEVKTIGLLNRIGQSDADRYTEWAVGIGYECTCGMLRDDVTQDVAILSAIRSVRARTVRQLMVGAVMVELRGKANPARVAQLLNELFDAEAKQ